MTTDQLGFLMIEQFTIMSKHISRSYSSHLPGITLNPVWSSTQSAIWSAVTVNSTTVDVPMTNTVRLNPTNWILGAGIVWSSQAMYTWITWKSCRDRFYKDRPE